MCRKRKLEDQDPPARNPKRFKTLLSMVNPLSSNSTLPTGQQMTQAKSMLAQVTSQINYIDSLPIGDNPFKPDYTPRTAKTAIVKKQQPLEAWISTLNTMLQREQNLAAAKLISKSSGAQAGDGNLYVQFVNIGLGDCTLITTPQGKLIMIDCGNEGATQDIILKPGFEKVKPMDYIRNRVKSKTFLGKSKEIDILLLTHTDKDHHNKISSILRPISGISIGITYYGGTEDFGAFATTAKFIREKCGNNDAFLRKVWIREDSGNKKNFTQAINGANVIATKGTPGAIGKEFIDPNSNAMVIYYEKDVSKVKSDFKLSLLAGNATGAWKGNKYYTNDAELKGPSEPKGSGEEPNRRSLMILVECFETQILICGDSTAVTERVAINHSVDLLNEVQYQRIGHHGSKTSSSQAFINELTSAKMAIASVGGISLKKHHLPQYPILQLYLPTTKTKKQKPPEHTIYAWEDLVRENFIDIQNNLWATGSNDTYVLKAPPPD